MSNVPSRRSSVLTGVCIFSDFDALRISSVFAHVKPRRMNSAARAIESAPTRTAHWFVSSRQAFQRWKTHACILNEHLCTFSPATITHPSYKRTDMLGKFAPQPYRGGPNAIGSYRIWKYWVRHETAFLRNGCYQTNQRDRHSPNGKYHQKRKGPPVSVIYRIDA